MITIDDIDNVLPQTQCGDCSYPACRPYAKAIVEQGESIDRCLPGGIDTLQALGKLTQQSVEPYLKEMANKAKPAQVALIDEATCIGCTKCITACPVDAIVGTGKFMHTILEKDCTGCGLCLPPCPMDCIELNPIATPSSEAKAHMAEQSRLKYFARKRRLQQKDLAKQQADKRAKLSDTQIDAIEQRKAYIAAARARVAAKRAESGDG